MIRRGLTLVEDLSVTVAPGQTLAVTGASGAGKTTLLRAISGLSDTDAGTILRPEGGLSQVFQEPRLMPWYSAHRNISLVVGGPTPDLTAVQWLERMGLASAGHLPPARLSGGMRQRVSIARALSTDPRTTPTRPRRSHTFTSTLTARRAPGGYSPEVHTTDGYPTS